MGIRLTGVVVLSTARQKVVGVGSAPGVQKGSCMLLSLPCTPYLGPPSDESGGIASSDRTQGAMSRDVSNPQDLLLDVADHSIAWDLLLARLAPLFPSARVDIMIGTSPAQVRHLGAIDRAEVREPVPAAVVGDLTVFVQWLQERGYSAIAR